MSFGEMRPRRERNRFAALGLTGDTPGYVPQAYAFFDWNRMLELNDRLAAGGLCAACEAQVERELCELLGPCRFFRCMDAAVERGTQLRHAADALHAFLESIDHHVRAGTDADPPTAARPLAVTLTLAPAAPPPPLAA